MSCGPGWIMGVAGRASPDGQDIVLICLSSGAGVPFYFIVRAIGKDRAIALAALLALCPGMWLCAV